MIAMGYNAGGYGAMTFPDEAAVAAWKRSTVSHEAYEDWIDELDSSSDPDETVEKRLARVAKGHDPKTNTVQQVAIEGTRVTLTWDTGEDAFRDGAGDFAALVRSADAFGAKGTFYFLGTGGAEGDFAYAVVLDGKRSKVSSVAPNRIMNVAYGNDYRAFTERVTSLHEVGNPAIKKLMASMREGAKPGKGAAGAHAEVTAGLAAFTDAQLASTVAKYPSLVPGGKGLTWPKDVYRPATVRAQFTDPPNEETRAAALWTLGKLAPDTAIRIAFELLARKSLHEHIASAALRVLAHATHDKAEAALMVAARYLRTSKSPYVLSGAQAILLASKHGKRDATLESLLAKIPRDAGGYVVAVLRQRKLRPLAPALARFAKRTKEHAAVQLLAEWKAKPRPTDKRTGAARR